MKMSEEGLDVSKHLNRGVEEKEVKLQAASYPTMISPDSVSKNRKVQENLIDEVSEWLGGARDGIHVSDLTRLKSAYWQKTRPDILPTEEEVGYFLAGKGHHGIVQYITTKPQYQEYEVEYGGVVGHIDMLRNDIPVELKTTRDYELKSPEELAGERSHYFEQLGFYCAMADSREGRLYLFYLTAKDDENGGTKPLIEVYDVEYGSLDPIRRELLRRKENLERALDESDPSLLPDCPDWMCSNCRYKDLCRGGEKK